MSASKICQGLQLKRTAPLCFQSTGLPDQYSWNVVSNNAYGGYILCQCIQSAYYTVGDQFEISSFHHIFLHGAGPDSPLEYRVEKLRDGKSMIHRQVYIYQKKQLCGVMLMIFNRVTKMTNKAGIQPYLNYSPFLMLADKKSILQNLGGAELFKTHQNARFFPFNRDHTFNEAVLGKTFILNTGDDTQGLGKIELYVGANGNPYFGEGDGLNSDEVLERVIYSAVRATKRDKADKELTLFAPEGETQKVVPNSKISYLLFLTYISDHGLLSSHAMALGLNYRDIRAAISLNHNVSFQTPQHQTSEFDWHVVCMKTIKNEHGKVNCQSVIFNKYGECVASNVQDGLLFVANAKNASFPKL